MNEPCSKEIRATVMFKQTALSRINVKGKVGTSDAEKCGVTRTKNQFHFALKLALLGTRFIV
jgi:hypothetical protein